MTSSVHSKELSQQISVIQNTVAKYFELELRSMLSKSRRRILCVPRQISMYLCHKYLSPIASSAEIGRKHHRDHATVLHAIKTIDILMVNDPALVKNVEELDFEIKSILGTDSLRNLKSLDKQIHGLLRYRRFLKTTIQEQNNNLTQSILKYGKS